MKTVEFSNGEYEGNRRVMPDKPSDDPRDMLCVRFTTRQTEEIMVDDYSLQLFHATRVQPLSIDEIKEKFPEPEEGSASRVVERFEACGLLNELPGNKFYSKFPENFPNFTDHTYDSDLEADKDARVFSLMKSQAGNREYWRDQSYFSTDGFFTQTQIKEIKKMLQDLKFFVKSSLSDNIKTESLEGLTFRRHKFYDLVLSLALIVFLSMASGKAMAGNDPGILAMQQFAEAVSIAPLSTDELFAGIEWSKANNLSKWRHGPLESNDPGRSVNVFELQDVYKFAMPQESMTGVMAAQVTPFANSDCGSQIMVASDSIGKVDYSCLRTVKFATTSVCENFGDDSFCQVADKVKWAMDQKALGETFESKQ